MFNPTELTQLIAGAVLWWLAVYLLSRNLHSKIARLIFLLLLSFAVLITMETVYPHLRSVGPSDWLNKATSWSYILPIPLLFHLSAVVTGRSGKKSNRWLLVTFYTVALIYAALSVFSNYMVDYSATKTYVASLGYLNPRGPAFFTLSYVSAITSIASFIYYFSSFRSATKRDRWKFGLPALTSLAYAILAPILIHMYVYGNLEQAIRLTGPFLLIPLMPILVSIIWFKLISDIDSIFDIKEFTYLTAAIATINLVNGLIFFSFAPLLGESSYYLVAIFIFITIFTHGFYDWLTTFIRDLLYNAGGGFSLITDQEVADLVRNFHNPEKLETNSLLKFTAVNSRATGKKLVDSAQNLTREAIEYFKQTDFPRRTKQNLKYQLLKMATLDEAEEGQILWELGFDGYPMKIMSGESATRKPLFKVESMSDYTATSRNAFIALKKEAIHDLAWRLSYLERISK